MIHLYGLFENPKSLKLVDFVPSCLMPSHLAYLMNVDTQDCAKRSMVNSSKDNCSKLTSLARPLLDLYNVKATKKRTAQNHLVD